MIILQNNLFVVVGYDDLYWTFLLFWDGLRLDARIDLAINKVLNERANIFNCKLLVLIEGELLILDGLLNGECGPLIDLQVQIAGVGSE